MAVRKGRKHFFTVAAVFILLEIAAVSLLHSSSSMHNVWINRASHRVMGAAWGETQKMRDYFHLREENENLAKENAMLLKQLSLLETYAASVPDTLVDQFSYTFAKVVKMSRNSQHNYIILNKGRNQGVEPMDGVITSNGAVGIIHAVDKNYSYALSFTNTKVSVSAQLGHDGPVAPLVWSGARTDDAILGGIPLGYQISQRDTVFTSGHSSIFPSGIPLGVAVGKQTKTGATDNVSVRLFQDMGSIQYVSIVKNLGRKEIEALAELEVAQ